MGTKNITLAIDETLLQQARVLATMRRTSVNEMVRGYLTAEVQAEKLHDEATNALLKLARESDADFGPGPYDRNGASRGTDFDR